ncbi:hypothetical protein [Thermomonas carbonis]|uniref:Lipoprotein n=1 Tax=Thermomonas carbonis TaxID=1463158 RepID=A0A7G9SU79_9GAMM|nr:hypothetical protein [Thermomonas carbonis]QNN71404.1 hypothetical protein H9L16_07645 [Thermomonas carbonis]GHC09813.1 hypothetical protein GCM10010080_26440 [Thermomonas carbonis]
MRATTKLFAAWVLAMVALTGCKPAPKAIFVLEPSVVSSCQQPIATRVRWDVSPLGLKYAEVVVHNVGRRPKRWVGGDAKGDAVSGPWAHDGYTVVLKSLNGVVLATRTLTTTPCPGSDWL